MGARLADPDAIRLEGLCDGARSRARIRLGTSGGGIERLEARFAGRGFAPHRHDTYAIGITLAGVQAFRYRGMLHRCRPGQCHVLHPDEQHDGAAADAEGFAYRIAYLDPALVGAALGSGPLPFVADPVLVLSPTQRTLLAQTLDPGAPANELTRTDAIATLAELLAARCGRPIASGALDLPALLAVRERITAEPAAWPSAAALERLSGLDRWTLARQFRAAFGTSPTRFRSMRRLDRARAMLARGLPAAEAAAAAGFADQSHLSRQFKQAYGLTPGQWTRAVAAG